MLKGALSTVTKFSVVSLDFLQRRHVKLGRLLWEWWARS
jgi:hypothetical protein